MRVRVMLLASGFLLQVAFASAQTITEFPLSGPNGNLEEIAAGPDGNLWFTEVTGDKIGKITPSGVVTEFGLAPDSGPHGIAAGPDGNLWFAEETSNKIGRITTAGIVTEFPLPQNNSHPHTITGGPDGNVWFTLENANRIGRITPEGVITTFLIPTASSGPKGITAGPDGALWFVEEDGDKIGRITTAGVFTEFPIPNGSVARRIATGPDGALWFTASGRNRIGRMTTTGAYSDFAIPTANSEPVGITAGPDGALWFTESARNRIGRITTAGVITELIIPTGGSEPDGIALGRDRNIWFLETASHKIGRVNITNACGNPEGSLCLNNGRFQVSTTWRRTNGDTGAGHAIGLTDDSGYFWFFNSGNIELVVKTLNACGLNDHFWVFGGGLTNVEVHVTVRDTLTGAVKEYVNPQSTPLQPIQDTAAFSGCAVAPGAAEEGSAGIESAGDSDAMAAAAPPGGEAYSWTEVLPLEAVAVTACVPSSTAMCLNGRFKVEATWLRNNGDTGPGRAIQLTPDSGYFWFFSSGNVELITKVLNACGLNQHQWVFAGGLTNVQVELTVTDTLTGAVKHYVNPQGTAFQPIQDTSAFSTCP